MSGSVVDPTTMYKRDGGVFGRDFCSAKHPTADGVWCRRMPGHEQRDDLGHGAHVHEISELEYWD